MFIDVADELSSALQVEITFIMTIVVIDLFEIVAVKDADGEGRFFFLVVDACLNVLHIDIESTFIA